MLLELKSRYLKTKWWKRIQMVEHFLSSAMILCAMCVLVILRTTIIKHRSDLERTSLDRTVFVFCLWLCLYEHIRTFFNNPSECIGSDVFREYSLHIFRILGVSVPFKGRTQHIFVALYPKIRMNFRLIHAP